MIMEVLVGPAYVRDLTGSSGGGVVVVPAPVAAAQDDDNNNKKDAVSSSCLFLKEEETGSDDSSESSSSIGAPGDSDDDSDEDEKDANREVSSASKLSLDSLEECLPIKRGLSSHFSGKSKSFANLSDVSSTCSTVKDLEKPENPFNKRRRVLIASKWSRKSSFYSWHNPKSMPLLTVHEDQDHHDHHLHDRHDHDDDDDHQLPHHNPVGEDKNLTRVCGNRFKKKIGFKSQSCFSLADLHEEDCQ